MPKLTEQDEKVLDKLSNKIFDTLYIELRLSNQRANKIAENAMKLIREQAVIGERQ